MQIRPIWFTVDGVILTALMIMQILVAPAPHARSIGLLHRPETDGRCELIGPRGKCEKRGEKRKGKGKGEKETKSKQKRNSRQSTMFPYYFP